MDESTIKSLIILEQVKCDYVTISGKFGVEKLTEENLYTRISRTEDKRNKIYAIEEEVQNQIKILLELTRNQTKIL